MLTLGPIVRLALSAVLLGAVPVSGRAAALLQIEASEGDFLGVSALSGDGNVVVGWCDFGACRGVPGGSFVSLLPLDYPRAVSADGSVVVGSESTPDGARAMRWTEAGGALRLGPELTGTLWSEAFGVSADGTVVVGTLAMGQPWQTYAFRWTAAQGIRLVWSSAYALGGSADGATLVGVSFETGATLWRVGQPPIPLTPGWTGHEAYAASADGAVVVGGSGIGGGNGENWVAWRWTAASGPVLIEPPAPTLLASAWDVSADGAVVLATSTDDGVFLWSEAQGPRRLDDALRSYGVPVGGWRLHGGEPRLSADGRRVVGTAERDGAYVPFLAILAPACDDGLDNDGDGAADLADPQCASAAHNSERPPRRCGLGFEIALALPLLRALARRKR